MTHTEIKENTYDLKINDFKIHGVPYKVIIQIECFESMLKKVNHIYIEDDIAISFDEVDDETQKELLSLITEYIENSL